MFIQSELSDREIGRRSGLTQPPIAKLRDELESRNEISPTETRVGGDGQSYRVAPSVPRRGAGELPEAETEGFLDRLVTPEERRQQKRITQYLERLCVAFEDQEQFDTWASADDAATAVRAVLEAEAIQSLAASLGIYANNILDVAETLGYVHSPEATT